MKRLKHFLIGAVIALAAPVASLAATPAAAHFLHQHAALAVAYPVVAGLAALGFHDLVAGKPVKQFLLGALSLVAPFALSAIDSPTAQHFVANHPGPAGIYTLTAGLLLVLAHARETKKPPATG